MNSPVSAEQQYRAIRVHTQRGTQWFLQRRGWFRWKTVDWFTSEETAQAALNVMANPKVIYPKEPK